MEDQKDISNQISEALTRNTEDMFDDVSNAASAERVVTVSGSNKADKGLAVMGLGRGCCRVGRASNIGGCVHPYITV